MTWLAFVFFLAAADPDRGALSPWAIPVRGADTGLFLGGQLFAGVDAAAVGTDPDTMLPAFRLDRLEVGGGGLWQRRIGGLVRLETIRSAASQSAFGIDGNSLLPRLRLAYGVVRSEVLIGGIAVDVEARAGLVPEPWLETLERRLGARGLQGLGAERAGLLSASDLGTTLDVDIGDGWLDLRLSVVNGEGRAELERDAGKNIGALVVFVPFVFEAFGSPWALGGQIGGRLGSLGVAGVVDHRVMAAVFSSHPRLRLGLEGTAGFGFQQRAEQQPLTFGGFVDAVVVPTWLGIALRADATTVDRTVPDTFARRGLLAFFSDLGIDSSAHAARSRLFCGVDAVVLEPGASPAAGVASAGNAARIFLQLEMTGITDLVDLAALSTPGGQP
jgi:hypothetical protein